MHELSKELGIQIKDLMHFLNEIGANVRNHMSTIEDKYVDEARSHFPAVPKKSRVPGGIPVASVLNKVASPKLEPPKPESRVEPQSPVRKEPAKPANAPRFETAGAVNRPTGVKLASEKPKPAETVERTESRPPLPNHRPRNDKNDQRPAPSRNQIPSKDKDVRSRPFPAKDQPQRSLNNTGPSGNRPGEGQPRTDQTRQKPTQSRPGQSRPGQSRPGQSRPGQSRPGFGAARGENNQKRYQEKENRLKPPTRPAHFKKQGPRTTVKSVELPPFMTVKDFSQLIEVAAGEVIKKLMGLGLMATINQEIDFDTMSLLAGEFGISAKAALTEEQKLQVEEIEDDPKSLLTKPPVVTIMGHVDHGKTSLLDAIRETNVTAQEAGGITQHIGAYQVELNERKITFLDTPGHEAFTAMRARGAQATDIAVLVVAADDGVMPQTVEAVNHAKDANVPIIVAINKMDKPGANPDRIKQDLTEYSLVAEEWGGETIFVEVSAKQRTGIENLLEMILLVADVKDYKANPNRPAKGIIIEAQLDKGQGPVATVLVQNGTLQMGDNIIAGAAAGKVRTLINDKGKRVKKALPATPVEVIGFDELPEAGDILYVITEDRLARQLADKRMQLKRETELQHTQKVTLNDLFAKIKEGEIKELKIIIKADVQGSVEAIRQSLEQLSSDQVKVKVIHGGVGGIGEGDIMFASASNAIIIGFNVRPDPMAKRIAEKENVDIRLYRIIYNIIDDVKKAMEGLLEPEFKEVINGRAAVRVVYKVPKIGNVAGCYLVDGKINRNNDIRLLRDNIVIHEGKIGSLKRFKDDVREVAEGFEFGLGIEKFNDLKEGDIIEAFTMEEVKRNG